MALTLTNAIKRPIAYAVEVAEVGTKRRAGMLAVQSVMGASQLKLIRNSTTVVTLNFSTLPVVGNDIVLTNAAITSGTYAASLSDIDSGTWSAELVSVSDTTNKKITGTFGRTGTDFTCTADIPANGPAYIGTITFTLPASLDSNAYVDVVAINCGGPALLGVSGRTYLADLHYVGGTSAVNTTGAIANTVDDVVYQDERYGSFTYSIPVSNKSGADSYKVRLQMCENFSEITAAGQRVFSVRAQPGTANEVTQADIDIYDAVGGRGIAYEVDMTVAVTASTLVIQTVSQTQEPLLNGIVVRSASGGAYSPPSSPPSLPGGTTETTVIRSTDFAIPTYWQGIHSHHYPDDLQTYDGYTPETSINFPYGYRRTHNYRGAFWTDNHIGFGSYAWNTAQDSWSDLDDFVQACVDDGARILYNLFPTPDHLRWPGMENAPGRYPSFPGSNTTPNDMNDVKAFVTALLTRYNVIPNGQMKIHAIEVMNEPNAAGSIAGDSSPFWLGRDYDDTTAGRNRRLDDLATLHKAVYEAVKAADPRVLVLGPPFIPGSYSAANSLAYYNRGILGGGTPLDYTDVLTCHPYHGSGQSSSGSAAASHIHTVCKSYWDAMRPVHATKPIWSTEAGNEASASASDHATAIKRKAMICAGLGMEVMCWYSYETSVDGLGRPNVNTAPRDALRDVAAKMVGKTMTRCSILSNGTVWATFSDGTSWNV